MEPLDEIDRGSVLLEYIVEIRGLTGRQHEFLLDLNNLGLHRYVSRKTIHTSGP
jgi:hypothetical protein